MTCLRFVHAADLHLDSPFKGLRSSAPEHVANALYEATFKAYENIIDLCIREQADALLIAGDVYDGADRSLRAQSKFVEGLNKLHDVGIRSFVCHGNHDPLDGWEAQLAYPPSCYRFGAKFEAVPVFQNDPERAVVHGISYPQRDVKENLVNRLGPVDPKPFSIGLLHTNVGNDPGHAPYAPCSLNDLLQSGIDYWALGNIHTRRVLHEQKPAVIYPGNPQGRHLKESGARGVYLVDVEDGGNVNPEFRVVDSVRWERFDTDISLFDSEQAMLDALHKSVEALLDGANGRPVIVRATLTGRGELNPFLRRANVLDDLVEQINEAWTGRTPFVWCERIDDETAPPFDRKTRLEGSDFLAEVLRTADGARANSQAMTRLCSGLSELYEHHRHQRYLPAAPNDDELAVLIDEAETIAVSLLVENE